MIFDYDVVVLGGGSAGMAAAIEASDKGATVAILEMEQALGGILKQCIHNGFGLHYFKEELTGPEYAARFEEILKTKKIDVYLKTTVTSVTADKVIKAASPRGLYRFRAGAVVIAFGSRERSAGGIWQAGDRPAGVYTAGFAQKLTNIDGYMTGKRVVILGSGDIGLIMARRMTFEGAKVLAVLELMPYSSGLNRNIVQCVKDFDIPLRFSHTITKVVGKDRVEGVWVAPVDEKQQPMFDRAELIACDCVLLSVGLIPSVDLFDKLGLAKSPVTGSFVVDEDRQTSVGGIFAAGNCLHVHDLVDNVTGEGQVAGVAAAEYALGKKRTGKSFDVSVSGGVRYALPQKVRQGGEGRLKLYFRVGKIYKNVRLVVTCGDEVIFAKKYQILSPGEMEAVELDRAKIKGDITIATEGS